MIAEKPDAARKIANALGKVDVKKIRGMEVLEANSSSGTKYTVCSALGHLYELSDPGVDRGISPVFDVDWFVKSKSGFSSRIGPGRANPALANRLSVIRELGGSSTSVVNACDFDLEGEAIGSNILDIACAESLALRLRAKFSTLTGEEIKQAFAALEPPNRGLAEAGRMRHLLDFLWGVNLSRVLSSSARNAGKFSNVTIGRVQGPALAFVVDRELELMTHVPIPYWKICCTLEKGGVKFQVEYAKGVIRNQSLASEIFEKVSSSNTAHVRSITHSTRTVSPRYPFNLADLQREAYRIHKIGPSTTLAVAQKLYLKSLISYPRTSSQKLPRSIGYSKILDRLSRSRFSGVVTLLDSIAARRNLPCEGPGTDPAHPAIFPTGEAPPSNLDVMENKILELVVRRFCSAFAPDARLEELSAVFDIASVDFGYSGSKVSEKGWMLVYPYEQLVSDHPDVELREEETISIVDRNKEEKFDSPPPRYNEMTLVAKLTSENVGTKSTRAETVVTLIKRGYLTRKGPLVPTENALLLMEHLRSECPKIVSPEMTRELEEKIDLLETGRESPSKILAQAMISLRESISNLKGANLSSFGASDTSSKTKISTIGSCPTCKTGSLRVLTSFKTGKRFVGCSNYSKGCRTSSPLPRRGVVKPTGKTCGGCQWPTILVWFGRRPWRICPNINCSTAKKRSAQ